MSLEKWSNCGESLSDLTLSKLFSFRCLYRFWPKCVGIFAFLFRGTVTFSPEQCQGRPSVCCAMNNKAPTQHRPMAESLMLPHILRSAQPCPPAHPAVALADGFGPIPRIFRSNGAVSQGLPRASCGDRTYICRCMTGRFLAARFHGSPQQDPERRFDVSL